MERREGDKMESAAVLSWRTVIGSLERVDSLSPEILFCRHISSQSLCGAQNLNRLIILSLFIFQVLLSMNPS